MAIKRGSSAIKSALTENSGGGVNVSYTSFSAGMTYRINVQSTENIVEYFAASVYKVFNTSPVVSGDNLYQKAADLLLADSRKIKDKASSKEVWTHSNKIRPKPRYILGAVDMETGEKMFIDLTATQAKAVVSILKKKERKLTNIAFEISKDAEGKVSITQLDEDELEASELAFLEKAKSIEFSDEEFESLLQERSHEEQLEDIYAFDRKLAERLDDSKVGGGSGNTIEADVDEDSLPF